MGPAEARPAQNPLLTQVFGEREEEVVQRLSCGSGTWAASKKGKLVTGERRHDSTPHPSPKPRGASVF